MLSTIIIGSISGLLLENIFASTVDTIQYIVAITMAALKKQVSENSSTEFENIRIKTNMPRCYILIWTQKELIAKISPWSTKKECCQKTPGVLLHNDLMTCIDHQCIKTSYKITVLHGISACMNTNEKTLVTKAFINSQFDHSILIRMSHIWKLNIPYMGLTKQRMTNNKIKTEAKCNIF